MRRTLLLASLMGSFLSFSPSVLFAVNAELDCAHGVVQRAGVALVKKYPNSKPGLDMAVFVGVHPKAVFNSHQYGPVPRVNFFGGSCDTTDQSSAHAAVRELYEETSKAVKLNASALQNGARGYAGYVYSGDKKAKGAPSTPGLNYIQMFFLRDDNLSASQLSKVQSAALKNPKLAHHFKETKETVAIPLQDLLDRARHMANLEQTGQYKQLDHPNTYIFETRGDGQGNGRKKVFMERHYLKNMARDIIRDANNFPGICARLMASTAVPAAKAAPAPKKAAPAPKKAAAAPKTVPAAKAAPAPKKAAPAQPSVKQTKAAQKLAAQKAKAAQKAAAQQAKVAAQKAKAAQKLAAQKAKVAAKQAAQQAKIKAKQAKAAQKLAAQKAKAAAKQAKAAQKAAAKKKKP